MGKTQSGAVWLDPNKTSPFDFYQYWRNVADADVLKCIRMLTFLPLEEIDKMDSWEGAQLNTAKEILAYELTNLSMEKRKRRKRRKAQELCLVKVMRRRCDCTAYRRRSYRRKDRYSYNACEERTCYI